MDTSYEENLLRLTADIVSAHASRNRMPSDQLTELIRSVHAALGQVGSEASELLPEQQEPAVPIKRSVFPDYIICLEDGKKLKMLKRHLSSAYKMTGDDYRKKWSLPPNYPMVAPNYANMRSALAKKIGLGRKQEDVPAEPAVLKLPEKMRGAKSTR